TLLGCDALALTPFNDSSNAAFAANDNPIVNAQGRILTTLPQFRWSHPFGEAFGISRRTGFPVFYVSQAGDGSIVRVSLDSTRRFMFEKIITGFAVNGGAPGSILGPSGLQYSFRKDTLYVVDGANNTLTSIDDVSFVSSNGLHVNPSGQTFSGPSAKRAKLLFKGAPLNGPISSALLPNGNLVLGNTLDPNGINLMVEFSSRGKLLARKNVDTGAAGAIFGMVATGHEYGETKLYFNDDNLNAVQVLER
ncbi:MAG TPA: hypothetical protein VGN11_11270, partial [Candidatus Baltobacteraceae bacterium]|nr:hypothetical protein [Candidatus Baltobacteraceae bacterium]